MDGGRTDPSRGEPRGRRWLVRAGQLVLTVLVAGFILDRVGLSVEDLGDVDPARWTPRWGPFTLSCLVLLAGYGMSGLLWGRMVRELGGGRVAPGTSVRLYMIANLGRYIPGKLWQIAGLALLARQKGIPPRVATGAAVLGQGVALVAATILGLATLLQASPAQRRIGLWLGVAFGAAVLLALVPQVSRRLWRAWFRLAREDPPTGGLPGPAFALRWTALYLLNWGIYVIAFWILAESFRLPGSLFETGPAFAAAYVLGFVAVFAPAGIGVREGFLTLFLAPVTGAPAAATLSVAARLWTTGVEVLPATVLWLRHLSLARDGGRGGGVAGGPDVDPLSQRRGAGHGAAEAGTSADTEDVRRREP